MLQPVIYWQIERELRVRYVRECFYIVGQPVPVNSLLEMCKKIFCHAYSLTGSGTKYLEKGLLHNVLVCLMMMMVI